MSSVRNDKQTFGTLAGFVVFMGHFNRNKLVLCSVNEQNRSSTALHGLNR